MKKILFLAICIIYGLKMEAQSASESYTDSITDNFVKQLNLFPQEKLYLQIDKPNYISGEKIWFRAHLVDALLNKQANASRYVYAELINPLDSVISRVKIRPDSLGLFHGYIPIEEDVPEGIYTIRSYTLFMKNLGEDYFFRKQILITDPLSLKFNMDTKFAFEGDEHVTLTLKFTDKSNNSFEPGNVELLMGMKTASLKFGKDTIARYSFKMPEKEGSRILKISLRYNGKIYNKYIYVPFPKDDYNVSFFAEGGNLLEGVSNALTFKAIGSDGLSDSVTVAIVDDQGEEIVHCKTTYQGMGSFHLIPMPGKKYFAECTNSENRIKRFELPPAVTNHCGLKVSRAQNSIYVAVNKSADYTKKEDLYLLVHTRGAVLYNKKWDSSKEYIIFEKDFFPSGIGHFVLYDSNKNVISERLIFNYYENDMARTDFSTDQENYAARQHVLSSIKIADVTQAPLSGNFSISVTDDKDVKIDVRNTIITDLLLTSELKGYIENPSYYFGLNVHSAMYALDLLMTTQGWCRYPIPEVMQGKMARPSLPLESSQTIRGKVDGIFRSIKDGYVSVLAMEDSSVNAHVVQTDQKGLFELKDIEYPDGTRFVVQAKTNKDRGNVFLELDKTDPYPPVSQSIPVDYNSINTPSAEYIAKADEKYLTENGIRVHNLAEVEVTAKRNPETESKYYSPVSSGRIITANDIDKRHIHDMRSLLMQISGLMVINDGLSVRGQGAPLIVIDDVPYEGYDIFSMEVSDISDLFLIKDASAGVMFGSQATNGALVISTKRGLGIYTKSVNKNINDYRPLGYQKPIEFYSPKYDVEPENPTPDLRTTIYWKPDVKVPVNGEIMLDFYAADSPTSYSVVIEGVSDYGHIIHKVAKIERDKVE